MTTKVQPRLYACPGCKTDAWSSPSASEGEPQCARCGRPMKMMYGAEAVLPAETEPADRSLTAYLAAPLPDEALGQTENPANMFGKYVFLREVGRGATGRVVKAWDTYLSRHVALKFLHSTAPKNVELDATERVQDFLREARLAARLRHPNIIPIHEVDCREGRYYISMDFVDGGTLAELIHGPQDARVRTRFYQHPEQFLSLLRTIAIAVHHAHTQIPPVVHRDLKPQNVLIDTQGHPQVADFGLANEVQVDSGEGRKEGIRGTPAYMAPEQALGENGDIDARTDVYSLGIILYEMLAGDPPFKGSNIPSILRKIVTEPPEPPGRVVKRLLKKSPEVAACRTEMRADLEAICLKALSKNRDDRYPTALDFADALERWTRPAPQASISRTTEVRGFFKKRRVRAVAIATALLLALLLSVPLLRSSPPSSAHASAPGDDIAHVASGLLSSGKWTALRGAVTELRARAAHHPRLNEFERALDERAAHLSGRRKEWAALMNRLGSGSVDPDELSRRLRESPETEEEFRGALVRSAGRRLAALLEEARAIAEAGPGDSWLGQEMKDRAQTTRDRIETLTALAANRDFGIDIRPMAEIRAQLDRVLAWNGSWNLRINVHPYAEFRILQGSREVAREFTPAMMKQLPIGDEEPTLELFWPSEKDPRRRWSGPLPRLRPDETVVVSGSIERSQIEVERK